MASKKRILTWLGTVILLASSLFACASSVPARQAALDPSNPDAPESPRTVPSENRSAPKAMDANSSMAAPDANAEPIRQDHPHQPPAGTGATPVGTTEGSAPAAPSSSASKTVYTCTMHPEVTSEKPGKCPKCGMKLVPKAKAAAPNPSTHGQGAAGGLTPSSTEVSQ